MIVRALAVIAVMVIMSSCTGIETSAPALDTAVVPPEQPTRDDALAVMLSSARTDRLAGRLTQAEATLEAALRIAPEDARLWLELAEIQFAAGEFASARSLAERALLLAAGDADVIEAAERIRRQTAE